MLEFAVYVVRVTRSIYDALISWQKRQATEG